MGKSEFLNQQLANLKVLREKFYRYHWIAKEAVVYNAEIQKEYKLLDKYIDSLTECFIKVCRQAPLNLGETLEYSSIKEEQGENREIFEALSIIELDFNQLIFELEKGLKENDFDSVTTELLADILSFFEKRYWLINKFLSTKNNKYMSTSISRI